MNEERRNTLIFILYFTSGIVGQFCKMHNIFPFVSLVFVWAEILLSIFILISAFRKGSFNFNSDSKIFLFIFLYVHIVDVYYVLFPVIPRICLLGVPVSQFVFYQRLFLTSLAIICAVCIKDNVNYRYVAIFIALIPTFFFTFFVSGSLSFYIDNLKEMGGDEYHENGLLSRFAIARYSCNAILANLFMMGKWSKNVVVDRTIFGIILLVNLFFVVFMAKRGPIIFLTVAVVFYLVSRRFISVSQTIKVSVSILLISVAIYFIAGLIDEKYYSFAIERFLNTSDDGGSGRIGDSDALYPSVIQQFMQSPWFGSYFRCTDKTWVFGQYPHNIILESLISFGIIFSVFFFTFIIKMVVKSFYLIKNNDNSFLVVLLFLFQLGNMMTSSSLFMRLDFWLPFAMLCALKNKKYEFNS